MRVTQVSSVKEQVVAKKNELFNNNIGLNWSLCDPKDDQTIDVEVSSI